jgi:DNA polymerase-3 subunit gamma/tau
MSPEENYLTIYRRFRPETFDEILGQTHVVKVLENQISTDSVGHAYLFCGTRGTGKTTMARLLAKGVNCLGENSRPCGICQNCMDIKNGTFVDVAEIDAASNNSVDNVRELRESVIYPPSIGRKKVYIIDEVHMFSKSAFNALLKTLEEPPDHVIFILATTEAGKLPATILSRCLRFDFKRLSAVDLMAGMKKICATIKVPITEDALALLAGKADGSARDGLSILEQCLSAGGGEITRDLVLDILGSPDDDLLAALTDEVAGGRTAEALVLLDEMLRAGKEERRIIEDWIGYFHSVLMIQFLKDPARILSRSEENIARIKVQSEGLAVAMINDSIYRLSKLLNDSRWSSHVRILLEMTIIEMAEQKPSE